MEARVKRAIDTLLDAFNKRELVKGNCSACAVGNLVAKGVGGFFYKDVFDILSFSSNNHLWGLLFQTNDSGFQQIHECYLDNHEVLENIASTEFNWKELAQIEHAFETNTKIHGSQYLFCSDEEVKKDQIKGLEAVVKVMLSFSNDNETSVKEVFNDKLQPIDS